MGVKNLFWAFWCILAVGVFAGCDGKSKGQSGSNGTSAGTENAGPAKPVKGGAELVGAWYSADEQGNADLLGLEFLKDGKVMLYPDPTFSNVATWDYSVLDGGRIRMSIPGSGETLVFTSALSGDTLKFEAEGQGPFHGGSYKRLSAGQTVAQAHKAKLDEEKKRRDALVQELRDILKQPKLVLTAADPKMTLTRFAFDLQGQPEALQGFAYVEGTTPTKRQAMISIGNSAAPKPIPQVIVQIGQVVGPPGMQQIQGEVIRLDARRESDKLVISNGGHTLRPDPEVYSAVSGAYESEVKKREAAIAAFIDPLGAYLRLEGDLTYPKNLNSAPQKIKLAMLRVEGKPAMLVADVRNNANPVPTAFSMPAVVMLADGKPMLQIPAMQASLSTAGDDQKSLQGPWGGQLASLRIVESLSKEQLLERRAAIKDFLDKQLRAGVSLRGIVIPQEGDQNRWPAPIYLELKGDEKRALTGLIRYHDLGGEFNVSGTVSETLAGAVLNIATTGLTKNSKMHPLLRGQRTITLNVTGAEKGLAMVGSTPGAGSVSMEMVTDEEVRGEMEQFKKLLTGSSAAGAAFVRERPTNINPAKFGIPEFHLKLDPSGDTVTGEVTKGGRGDPQGPGTVTGKLITDSGRVSLVLDQPRNPTGRPGGVPACKYWLWVVFDPEKGTALAGHSLSETMNPPTTNEMLLREVKN